MRILVINPVGHPRWDEQDRKIYLSYASPETAVDVYSLPRGPPSVESPEAHAEVIPLVVERAVHLHSNYDAVIVNCFLDPAVDILKGILRKPVIGPCEASLALASALSRKIAIVTVGNEALWMIEERVRHLGYLSYLVSLKGIRLTVLQLDENKEKTKSEVTKKAKEAVSEGAEVIVLGCTGLSGLAKEVQDALGTPVIDPSGAALKVAESMVKLGLFNPRAPD